MTPLRPASLLLLGSGLVLPGCSPPGPVATASPPSLEDIYVLHSVREPRAAAAGACAAAKTGFVPAATDAERYFTFWSLETDPASGRLVDASRRQVAELHGCFGATAEPARQSFYAEVRMGSLTFSGRGECLALQVDVPQPGLYPVRCQLVLGDLPAPYVGGILTTSTLTSQAPFGSETVPPGYTQASIATIRLWRVPGPR